MGIPTPMIACFIVEFFRKLECEIRPESDLLRTQRFFDFCVFQIFLAAYSSLATEKSAFEESRGRQRVSGRLLEGGHEPA